MEIITPNDGYQYFFGYYDLQPLNSTQDKHLCHRVPFCDRIPNADDVAELGVIDMRTHTFEKLAETTAWNFQQGAMLRWYRDDDHIIYNVRRENGIGAEIRNIRTGEVRALPRPIADLNSTGKYAVSINFSRVYDFRAGYGYAGLPDPYGGEYAPEDDGVYLMDTETGECRLIIDYARLRREFPQLPFTDGKLVVNHITFNPSGDRFLFLLRNFPLPGQSMWRTMMLSSDLDGNLCKLTDYCINSHYHWKNDREILIITSGWTEKTDYSLFLVEDLTAKKTRLPEPNPLNDDIHCIYSPDRKLIVGDGYWDNRGIRTIWLHDPEKNLHYPLIEVNSPESPKPEDTDKRCDLHVRWSRDGSFLTFDTIYDGSRHICKFDMTEPAGSRLMP